MGSFLEMMALGYILCGAAAFALLTLVPYVRLGTRKGAVVGAIAIALVDVPASIVGALAADRVRAWLAIAAAAGCFVGGHALVLLAARRLAHEEARGGARALVVRATVTAVASVATLFATVLMLFPSFDQVGGLGGPFH